MSGTLAPRSRRSADNRTMRTSGTVSSSPVHRIRRTYLSALPISAVDSGGAYTITAGTIPDWSDFSNLYDLYRIRRVTFKFVNWRTAAPTGTGEAFPTMVTVLDFNDTTAPATVTELITYGNHEIHQFEEGKRTYTRSFTPKLQIQSASSTSTVLASEGTWARTSVTTDPWLGLKYWLTNYNSTTYNNTALNLYMVFDLEFKVTK